MKAFLTGSRIYGNPTDDSDIDLVVRLNESEREDLIKLSESGTVPIKFGNLNLIVATSDEAYAGWLLAKKCCLEKVLELGRNLTKDECIEIHDDIRQAANLPYGNDSEENDR